MSQTSRAAKRSKKSSHVVVAAGRTTRAEKRRAGRTLLVRYFSKAHLLAAAWKAKEWDFNRQVRPEQVEHLPDFMYPVTLHFPHYHRAGVRCEEHMRCSVFAPADALGWPHDLRLTFDVPLAFWEALPKEHVTLRA